jgi:HK97 family phage prohead protease
MPIKMERQYRTMATPLTIQQENKRFDSDFYVEGYAATWNRYPLFEDEDGIIYEQFLPEAFRGTDFSDVIFQYNHDGRVFARTSNKTLLVEPDNKGLFQAADLRLTESSRSMYEDIATRLITKMSWAFLPDKKTLEYDKASRTIIHHNIPKVFDVSAVSYPANSGTEIDARSFCNGVIAERLGEFQKRSQQIQKIKLLIEV